LQGRAQIRERRMEKREPRRAGTAGEAVVEDEER
jgi:hypothetical protein